MESNDLIKSNVLKLQQANATPQDIETYVKSAVNEGQNQKPSFLQEEGQNAKDLWKTATSPQDLASPLEGGGQAADLLVNTPFKHAAGAVNSLATSISPGLKGLEGDFSKGVQTIAQTPVGRGLIGGAQAFSQAHPRVSAALGGTGKMVNAGLTVSTIGQGAGAVKNAFQGEQATKGITNTLTQNLNYDPDVANDIASTIANNGKAAQYVASGNFDGAKAILDNAMEGTTGTVSSDLQAAMHAIDDLKTVPYQIPFPTSALHTAGNIARSVGTGVARTAGAPLKLAAGIGGGGLLLKYMFPQFFQPK